VTAGLLADRIAEIKRLRRELKAATVEECAKVLDERSKFHEGEGEKAMREDDYANEMRDLASASALRATAATLRALIPPAAVAPPDPYEGRTVGEVICEMMAETPPEQATCGTRYRPGERHGCAAKPEARGEDECAGIACDATRAVLRRMLTRLDALEAK
jgi:hypothetical protein